MTRSGCRVGQSPLRNKGAGSEQADLDEDDEDTVVDAAEDLFAGPGAEQAAGGSAIP